MRGLGTFVNVCASSISLPRTWRVKGRIFLCFESQRRRSYGQGKKTVSICTTLVHRSAKIVRTLRNVPFLGIVSSSKLTRLVLFNVWKWCSLETLYLKVCVSSLVFLFWFGCLEIVKEFFLDKTCCRDFVAFEVLLALILKMKDILLFHSISVSLVDVFFGLFDCFSIVDSFI